MDPILVVVTTYTPRHLQRKKKNEWPLPFWIPRAQRRIANPSLVVLVISKKKKKHRRNKNGNSRQRHSKIPRVSEKQKLEGKTLSDSNRSLFAKIRNPTSTTNLSK